MCGLLVLALIYGTGCVIYSLFLWKRKDGEPFELKMPFLTLKTGGGDRPTPRSDGPSALPPQRQAPEIEAQKDVQQPPPASKGDKPKRVPRRAKRQPAVPPSPPAARSPRRGGRA